MAVENLKRSLIHFFAPFNPLNLSLSIVLSRSLNGSQNTAAIFIVIWLHARNERERASKLLTFMTTIKISFSVAYRKFFAAPHTTMLAAGRENVVANNREEKPQLSENKCLPICYYLQLYSAPQSAIAYNFNFSLFFREMHCSFIAQSSSSLSRCCSGVEIVVFRCNIRIVESKLLVFASNEISLLPVNCVRVGKWDMRELRRPFSCFTVTALQQQLPPTCRRISKKKFSFTAARAWKLSWESWNRVKRHQCTNESETQLRPSRNVNANQMWDSCPECGKEQGTPTEKIKFISKSGGWPWRRVREEGRNDNGKKRVKRKRGWNNYNHRSVPLRSSSPVSAAIALCA